MFSKSFVAFKTHFNDNRKLLIKLNPGKNQSVELHTNGVHNYNNNNVIGIIFVKEKYSLDFSNTNSMLRMYNGIMLLRTEKNINWQIKNKNIIITTLLIFPA